MSSDVLLSLDIASYPEAKFPAGTTIIEEGGRSDAVYVLKTGTCAVKANGEEISRLEVPGTIFGEISVLLDCPHTASVLTLEDSTCAVIDDFVEFMQERPGTLPQVNTQVRKRLATLHLTPDGVPLDVQYTGCPQVEFGKGETIVRQDSPADSAYVLLDGTVSVGAEDQSTPGTLIGIAACLGKRPHTATVTATSDCHALEIKDVAALFSRRPSAGLCIARQLARHSRAAADFIDIVTP